MSQYYVGVKIIFAWPEVKDGKEGYAVKYPDGYTSWSPKEVFEASYLPMGGGNDNSVTKQMVDKFMGDVRGTDMEDGKTTFVTARTVSGFAIHEASSCVDPKNYNSAIGVEMCMQEIVKNLWNYLGFVVQWGKYGINTNIGLNQTSK